MLSDDLKRHYHRHDWVGAGLAWAASPGFVVVTKLRVAQKLWSTRNPISKLFARLLWRQLATGHGCYFSLTAAIGPGLTLPHPVAIVVGDGCRIGRNVTLYQGVTLGRRQRGDEGCPYVADDVTIYAGAVVIGDIVIGQGAIVAANAVVTRDVAANETVGGNPARPLRRKVLAEFSDAPAELPLARGLNREGSLSA